MYLFVSLLLASMLGAGVAYAQGGPPLETDDPGTPGNGRWELNTALTVERTSSATVYGAPLGDANYGLGERIQLTFQVPLEIETNANTGFGRPELAVKWRFLDDTSAALAISTFPRVEFQSPVWARDPSEEGSSLLLPLELVKSWGTVALNAEAGYRLVKDGGDEMIYRLALGYPATSRLDLLSECSGSSELGSRNTELICQLGARDDVATNFTLMSAIGTRVAGNSAEHTRLLLYVGLQSRW
jgi:hypothetical protein